MKELDFTQFIEIVGSSCKNNYLKLDKAMMISFYATWCPACQDVLNIIDQIEPQYESDILQFKVDTDVDVILSSFFGVTSLPTMVFFANDQKPETMIGRVTEETLHSLIQETIKKHSG